MSIKAGTTSRIIFVKFRDKSVTTEYAGLSGLTSSSPGLACNYVRDSATSVTSVVLAPTTLGVYVPNGLCEVGATAFKGVYMFCLPDGALAVGAKSVVINFYGATNLEDYPIEIELTATDNQDGTRGGITALPAVVSGSAGGDEGELEVQSQAGGHRGLREGPRVAAARMLSEAAHGKGRPANGSRSPPGRGSVGAYGEDAAGRGSAGGWSGSAACRRASRAAARLAAVSASNWAGSFHTPAAYPPDQRSRRSVPGQQPDHAAEQDDRPDRADGRPDATDQPRRQADREDRVDQHPQDRAGQTALPAASRHDRHLLDLVTAPSIRPVGGVA
jgi:hypothetical protein